MVFVVLCTAQPAVVLVKILEDSKITNNFQF